jgi:dihydroflavonol-4-reductase
VTRSFANVAQILKDEEYKGPSTRIAPNFLLRITALFGREAKGMLEFLSMNLSTDNSNTRQLFGWVPIPFKQTVCDTGKAVKALHV